MHLQLDQARDAPLRWREAVHVGVGDLRRQDAFVLGAVDSEGCLTCTGSDFLLQARLRYCHRLFCDRCLAAYEAEVDLPVAFVVTPGSGDGPAAAEGSAGEQGARELEPEDLSTLGAVDGAIDLFRLICEQVELNVPMKPVCDTACRGLCPQCGIDRNREACACVAQQVDSRWAGLEAIRERLADNDNLS